MSNLALPVVGQDPLSASSIAPGTATPRPKRVLLICPPFQAFTIASLAVAQLATLLRSRGITCGESYLHFEFARIIGQRKYSHITDVASGLKGELLFAEGMYGTPQDEAMQAELTSVYGPYQERKLALDELARRCIDRVLTEDPELIGISTSFNQSIASIWIARLIRARIPNVKIVLGGAACSEPMGQRIVEGYPELDYVVSGFGERPLLALALGDQPSERLIRSYDAPPLDSLPVPEYDQYLKEAGDFVNDSRLALAFESSRGCWWGQKNHCTFCGLNGVEMHFTAKSSDRVATEVRALWDKYGRNLFATDTIMSREHLKTAMVELGRFENGPSLFYEVKSNMSEADIFFLKRARATTLQPGIESLNTHLLSLLKKGVTAIRNLALLKWCRERNILVMWNLLCAIPGETSDDYDQQLLLIDKIPHFYPPNSVNPIRIDRFSPYFKDYQQYGWERIEPFREYRVLHPSFSNDAINDVAYHFEGVGGVVPGRYLKRLRGAIKEWLERYQQNDGLFLDPEKGLVRNTADQGMRYGLAPELMRIIEMTHDVTPIERVISETGCTRSTLEQLGKAGILYLEGEKVLNLAVRTTPPSFD